MQVQQSRQIAIVGISAELPSGSYMEKNLDHESFFQFLMDRGQAYERIPGDRLNIDAWHGHGMGLIGTQMGSFLKDVDMFDHVEFGISSRDARAIAPATRKLLETCFLALLDSGIDYRARNVGCYTAATAFDITTVTEPDEFEARGSFAGYPSMVSNRISIHLDLLGPSVPTDNACSSGLTALHLAVQAVANNECEAAVVGGCQLNHRFIDWINYSQSSILSKDGKCKPFDISADGFGRAEGCVAVVIKPLEDAIRDGDHIYATILGSAINAAGGAAPPGAPVAEAQRNAMTQAFKRVGRNPKEVSYIELHATGTAKGDPTEANWVGEEFHRNRELLIGSVKGNIGHTEITAFLASLSKVLSVIENNVIPPNVNLEIPNPAIKWEKYNLKVPLEPISLPLIKGNKPLIAIAGAGIGGTSGHVVLEGPPRKPLDDSHAVDQSMNSFILMCGGLTPRTAIELGESIKNLVAEPGNKVDDIHSLSVILGRRIRQMTWRSYAILDASSSPSFSIPQSVPRTPNPIVFIFSGQGPQYKDMGRQLFAMFPVFRQSILDMDCVFQNLTGKSIVRDWGLFLGHFPESFSDVWPVALTLPSITMFQIALFDLLVSIGVKPDYMCGHSAGETAVMYASGAAPKSMAVELAIIRGECFTALEKLGGSMASLTCNAEVAHSLLDLYRNQNPSVIVEIACYNSPDAVALAGHEEALDQILVLAKNQGIACTKLQTKVPFHSSLTEGCREEYLTRLQDLFKRYPGHLMPNVPTYSTLTGKLLAKPYDATYFWSNTRSQVQFTRAMDNITSGQTASLIFVEISPHPVLLPYITSMATSTSIILPVVRRPRQKAGTHEPLSEYRDLLEFCGKFCATGHNSLDIASLNGKRRYDRKTRLPRYPFLKKRFPLYPENGWLVKQVASRLGPLNHPYLRLNKDTHPILAEHIIRGEPIMPAAGFLEMALEFGATAVMNVNFHSILSLSSEAPVKIEVSSQGSYWSIKSLMPVSGYPTGSPVAERLHADGYLTYDEVQSMDNLDIEAIRKRCHKHVGSAEFYESLGFFSSYGPHFQRVSYLCFNFSEALVFVEGLDNGLAEDGTYRLHPAILDAAFHATAYRPFHGDTDPNSYYLPAGVKALVLHRPNEAKVFPLHVYAYLQIKQWAPDYITYDISLIDRIGNVICSLRGFKVAKHNIAPPPVVSHAWEIAHQSIDPFEHISTLPLAYPETPHVDRTDLFRCLDLLASNLSRTSGATPISLNEMETRLRSKWSSFFEFLDVKHEKDSSSFWRSPHLDIILLRSSRMLRTIVELLCSGSRRILRICVGDGGSCILPIIQNIMEDFPNIYCEVVSFNVTSDMNIQYSRIDVLRSVRDEGIGGDTVLHSCDIVIALNLGSGRYHNRRGKFYQNFLSPGGFFIVAERGRDAWDYKLPGYQWFNAIFGPPIQVRDFNSYGRDLAKAGYTVISTSQRLLEDPFHFSFVAQNTSSTHLDNTLPLHPPEIHIFHYRFGDEIRLQEQLTLYLQSINISICIIANDGIDGGSCKGLVRVLKREHPTWSIRLLIFALSVSTSDREDFLHRLPKHLESEPEIVVSSELRGTVPRIVPLILPKERSGFPVITPNSYATLEPNEVLLQIESFSPQEGVTGIQAVVINGNSTGLPVGTTVFGLVLGYPVVGTFLPVDVDCLHTLDSHTGDPSSLCQYIPGFVAAALAPGLTLFRRPTRLTDLRILVTHVDTELGKSVSHLYSVMGIQYTGIPESTSILELTQLDPFDLIVSGHVDDRYVQILQYLLRPQTGKLFLWNDKVTGLQTLIRRDPYSIGDALRCIQSIMEGSSGIFVSAIDSRMVSNTPLTSVSGTKVTELTFRPDRTYILLGGLGNLGIHISLCLYRRGARHIVLTSRSGEDTVKNSSNIVLRRMFEYLKQLPGLNLSIISVDASTHTGLEAVFSSLIVKPAGCFILSATIRDKTFHLLSQEDFSVTFSSKCGVLEALKSVADLSSLEFVVAFSSVSGTFGFGGQANYAAANTALEEAMTSVPNGFSFICPGVLDTALVLASDSISNTFRLREIIPWSITTQDMIRCLEHAMYMFLSGHRFSRYIPNLDWNTLDQSLGMPHLGRHLLVQQEALHAGEAAQEERLSGIIRDELGISNEDLSPEIPLTSYGMDSLSASRLSLLLQPMLEVTQLQLLADMTLNGLRCRLKSAISVELPAPIPTLDMSEAVNPTQEMLDKYSFDFVNKPSSAVESIVGHHSLQVVLLTGSTGSLGCNILHHLLLREDVMRVYALNRRHDDGTSLYERQEAAFRSHGLPISHMISPKLVMVEAVLSEDDFRISKILFDELRSTITHIIHNAWRVDLSKPLSDFEDLILGTKNMINLALHSKLPSCPTLSFISSIAVFHQANLSMERAPEEPLESGNESWTSGYVQSKWIGERLCQLVAEKTTLKTNVIRVGLLTGSLNGCWETTHWFPSLVHSATKLGCLPNGDEDIYWIPSHIAAGAIVEMQATMNETLHLVHPHPVPWSSIMEPLSSLLNVPLVPYDEWFARLENAARYTSLNRDYQNLPQTAYPGLKLVDFFRFGTTASRGLNTESMGLLSKVVSEKGLQASQTLSGLLGQPLGLDDARLWMNYWWQIGFIPYGHL